MQTWGHDQNVLFYGDYDDANVIKVSDKTDYSSGEDKQINIINEFPLDRLVYDWYIFCDDDSFINTSMLPSFLSKLDPWVVHGMTGNGYDPDKTLFYCYGGAGIFMSRNMLHSMRGTLTHNDVIWGDVSLGMNMRRLGISTCNHEDICHTQPPSTYKLKRDQVKDHVSFHYIKELDHHQQLLQACSV